MNDRDIDVCVRRIKTFGPEEIGSEDWWAQGVQVEHLVVQLQQSPPTRNRVVQAMWLHQQTVLKSLIQNLIAVELWRDRVYPRLSASIRQSMLTKFILHSESTLIILLDEFFLDWFSDFVQKSEFEDALIAFTDYCARCMASLLGNKGSDEQHHFRVNVLGTSRLTRHLCENFSKLPASLVDRLLDTYDFVLCLVRHISEPPWTKRLSDGTWQKYQVEIQEWRAVSNQSLLQLTTLEGSTWVCLYCLLIPPVAQKQYRITQQRKESLVKLKPIVRALKSQLDLLKDVETYLQKLEGLDAENETFDPTPSIVTVDTIREGLTQSVQDWDGLVATVESLRNPPPSETLSKFTELHWVLDDSPEPEEDPIPIPDVAKPIQLELTSSDGDDPGISFRLGIDEKTSPPTVSQVEHKEFVRQKLVIFGGGDKVWIDATTLLTAVATIPLRQRGKGGATQHTQLRVELFQLEKSREWRQLGRMEDDLVLQLGFKKRCNNKSETKDYCLDKAFISFRRN